VPFTRGREVSKPSQQVVDEVRMLVEHGVREVTLLGQNVNSYGKDRVDRDGVAHELDFAELIHKVAEIDGLERIRFTTSHPMDCTDALIDAFATCKKLAPFFHLPIQSGSPKVLQGMRRAHGVDDYLAKIERLRKAVPDIALSTDLIVGFPGETEEDFEMTLALMREVRYATLFSFLYSPRPGTKAAEFKDDVPMAVKKQRLTRLQAIQDEMTDSWMAGYAGKIVDVLVEGPSRLQNAGPNSKLAEVKALGLPQLMGRTPENVIVNFAVETPAELVSRKGTIARVRIDHVRPHSLLGTLV
jgi:tRNA-2-methylthio-N6-dimethylallyladenosine synthase